MFLEEIYDVDILENLICEVKQRLDRNDVLGWLKTIAGFANAEGGDLFVGVEDKTNKLIGFERKEADIERNYINNTINQHLLPRPDTKISFVKYNIKGKELYIIKIHVDESNIKPVILKYHEMPMIFMRRDGYTNGATTEEIIEMSKHSIKTEYDQLISNERYNANDFTKLFTKYEKENNNKLTEKALASLGFYDSENTLKNGALLFKDDYSEGKVMMHCSVFSGFDKGSDRIVSINKINTNILDSIAYACEFVEQRMNHMIIKKSNAREDIDAFPKRAILEGVVNAVAHRDYFIDNSQINIVIYKDRLEITSPGKFYEGNPIKKTYDLSNIISKRRNSLISEVLVKCKLMEASGTGFDKIYNEYKNADNNHKPFIYSNNESFTLVLPDLTYQEGIRTDENPEVMFVPVKNGSNYDEKVLSYCYNKARKSSEIAKYLGLTDSSYFRKNVLECLIKENYLIKGKMANAACFKTNREKVSLA